MNVANFLPPFLVLLCWINSTSAFVSNPLPVISCKEAWKNLIPKNLHHYDFKQDAKLTSQGNLGYASYAERTKRQNCFKNWTILVYMAADNDLTPYAYLDLYEMEAGYKSERAAAASTLKNDLVIELDTEGDEGRRRLHLFQTPEPYNPNLNKEDFENRTVKDIQSPVVSLLPENSGESEAVRFQKFLEWGLENFPSLHTMVVVWGHGQGWAPLQPSAEEPSPGGRLLSINDAEVRALLSPFQTEPSADPPTAPPPAGKAVFAGRGFTGGIAFKESTGSYLDIPSLKNALASVFDKDHPLDLYASDACLMQMAEVATEISEHTRFIVGSTQVQNFLGLPYRRLLYEMNRKGLQEPFAVAKAMPTLFRQSMEASGLQGKIAPDGSCSITMSALSSSELNALLLPHLDLLAEALLEYLREEPLRGMDLKFILKTAPRFQGGAQEIGSFLVLLELLLKREAEETDGQVSRAALLLKNAVNRCREALNRTVLNHALGTQYSPYLGIHAFSLWLPVSRDEYQNRIAAFSSSTFYSKAPSWPKWLRALFLPQAK